MDSEWKTRSSWGVNQSLSEDPASNAVDYLRALKRSNQGLSPDPAFPHTPDLPPGGERRRNSRYQCEGSAELHSADSITHTWATVTELSRSGCYLEVQAASPAETPLDMVIEVRGVRFRTKGVVRVSYPFLGMGVAFTDISVADQARLDELLLILASGPAVSFAEPSHTEPDPVLPEVAKIDVSKIQDPLAVLGAVTVHFQASHLLTREEFADMIARVRRHKPGM